MSKRDEDLQRYFDGELDEIERARVEASLSEDDRLRLSALAEMRDLTSAVLDAESADVDVWSAVEEGLKRQRTRRWRERLRGRLAVGTSAGLLVAAAATLLIVFNPWSAKLPTNNCDIESMEMDGVSATVLTVADSRHGGDNERTIVFTTEED